MPDVGGEEDGGGPVEVVMDVVGGETCPGREGTGEAKTVAWIICNGYGGERRSVVGGWHRCENRIWWNEERRQTEWR